MACIYIKPVVLIAEESQLFEGSNTWLVPLQYSIFREKIKASERSRTEHDKNLGMYIFETMKKICVVLKQMKYFLIKHNLFYHPQNNTPPKFEFSAWKKF